ncbi:MAG: ThiF family adenylyltransferase [Candidatus Woesearchaeota archaeon]
MNHQSSNRAFFKEKQDTISNQQVLLFGESLTTEYTILNLAGLGFEHILHFSPTIKPKTHSVLAPLSQNTRWMYNVSDTMNTYLPFVQYEAFNSQVLNHIVSEFNPTIVVDTSQDYGEKIKHARLAQKLSIPYIGVTTTPLEIILHHTPIRTQQTAQKYTMQMLGGTLLADEVRKHTVLFSENEQITTDTQHISFAYDHATKKPIRWKAKPLNSVGIVGAGGIGTFTALAEVLKGTKNICIYDPDTVEIQNLNRQMLYAPAIGKSKAETLKKRLEQINQHIHIEAYTQRFEDAQKQPFDHLFCCTDTYQSRLLVDEYATQTQTPLLEGGCTPTLGVVSQYVPKFTQTITQKRNLAELAQQEKDTPSEPRSCATQANPSVITPNAVIGILLSLYANYQIDDQNHVTYLQKNLNFNSLLTKKFYA